MNNATFTVTALVCHDSQCAETSFCMDLYHSDAYGSGHSDTSYDKNLFPLREKCDAETQNK